LKKDDYKSWAKGLKKAGYATDKKYPEKLIDLIDRYKLYRFDNIVLKKKKSKEKLYKVKKGDTLYSISKKFNVSIDDLINYNNLDSDGITIGEQIIIGDK
jgi:LysM repeat protein